MKGMPVKSTPSSSLQSIIQKINYASMCHRFLCDSMWASFTVLSLSKAQSMLRSVSKYAHGSVLALNLSMDGPVKHPFLVNYSKKKNQTNCESNGTRIFVCNTRVLYKSYPHSRFTFLLVVSPFALSFLLSSPASASSSAPSCAKYPLQPCFW